MTYFIETLWIQRTAFAVGGVLAGLLVELVFMRRAQRLAKRTRAKWDDVFVDSLRGLPTVWLAAGGMYMSLNVGAIDPLLVSTLQSVLRVLIIGSVVIAGMRAAGSAVVLLSEQTGGAINSSTIVVNLVRMAVGVLGIFVIVTNLGVDLTPLIGALGIGGLAVALALQDTLGNLFAGVQIVLSKQIRPKDYIRLSSGEEGWVTDVKSRNTTIQTFPDGNLITVPNSMLAASTVVNFSMPRRALWVTVEVGVSYDSDLEHVEAVALDVATSVLSHQEGGLSTEPPIFRFHTFADSSVNFSIRMLVRAFESQAPVQHEFIKRLHKRFGEEGIEIPFPIRTVVMKTAEGPSTDGG